MTKKLKYHIIASLLIFIAVTAAYNFILMGEKGTVQSRLIYVFTLGGCELIINGILKEGL